MLEKLLEFYDLSTPVTQLKGWIIPAIIGAVSLIGGILNNRSRRKQDERNNAATLAANKELAAYSYGKDLEMWNRSNEYNDPRNQMQRLQGAGLNPNLVYGSGAVGNQSGAIPKHPTPQVDMSVTPRQLPSEQLPQMLSMYQNFQMRQAQVDNVKAQTENTHQKTMTEAVRRYMTEIQGKQAKENLYRSQVTREDQITAVQEGARQSSIKTEQEMSRLRQMSQQEIYQLLEAEYKRKAMKAVDIDNEKRQADLLFKTYRNQWMKEGITTSDNMFIRMMVRIMNEQGISVNDLFK